MDKKLKTRAFPRFTTNYVLACFFARKTQYILTRLFYVLPVICFQWMIRIQMPEMEFVIPRMVFEQIPIVRPKEYVLERTGIVKQSVKVLAVV